MLRGKGLMMITCLLSVFLIAFSGPESQPKPTAPVVKLLRLSGDTLVYKADWGKARGATGYLLSLRSSTTGWTGVPSARVSPDTTEILKPYKLGWDSVSFRLVVWG